MDSQELTPVEKTQKEDHFLPVLREPEKKPQKQREDDLFPVSKEPEDEHKKLKDDYVFPVFKEAEENEMQKLDDYLFSVSKEAEEKNENQKNDFVLPVLRKPELNPKKKREDYSLSVSKEPKDKHRIQEGDGIFSFFEDLLPEKKGEKREEADLLPVFRDLISILKKNTTVLDLMAEKCYLSLKPASLSAGVSTKDDRDIKRNENVGVALKITFIKIMEIETVSQKFTAEVLLQAKWYEPQLDNSTEEYDPTTMWEPKLVIMNRQDPVIASRVTHFVTHPEHTHALVTKRWRVSGYFTECLELEHFPIDVQDLTIAVSSDRSEDEVTLFEDKVDLSRVYTNTFEDAQEWFIYDHVESSTGHTTADYASTLCHPILNFQCRVGRKIGYFVWNIVFIIMLINGLSFTMYAINPDNGDRLAVIITLFLTTVTFKFVVKSSLPTIPYHTYLDLYILSTMVFLGLHAIQNACIKLFSRHLEHDVLEKYDKNLIAVLGICMIAYHFVFAIYIYFTASKRRRIMQEKDREYRKRKVDVKKMLRV